MKIGLIQTKQNELYDFGNKKARFTLEKAGELQQDMLMQTYELMNSAIEKGCDIIVTTEAINFAGPPEIVMGTYDELIPEKDSKMFDQLSKLAVKGNCYLVAGVYYKEKVNNSIKLYNAALIYNRTGKLIDIYHKTHLAGSEKNYLTPGNRYVVFDTDFGKVGVCICWDMQFPEVSRELAVRGADLVVCPSWGWEQIYGHARAYENGIYVASTMAVPYDCNIEGLRNPSEVISPEGKVLTRASYIIKDYVICEIDSLDSSKTRKLRLNDRRMDTYTKSYNA